MEAIAFIVFAGFLIWIANYDYDADGTIQHNKRARRKRNRDARKERDGF